MQVLQAGQACDAYHDNGFYRATVVRVDQQFSPPSCTVTFPGYDGEEHSLIHVRKRQKSPVGCKEVTTSEGLVYFINVNSGMTQWEVPSVPTPKASPPPMAKTRMVDNIWQAGPEAAAKTQTGLVDNVRQC